MNITQFPDNRLTAISLFAGCGGSSLGYKMAGYDVRLAVEWDAGAAAVYRRNFPDTPIYQGDIGDLSVSEALTIAELKPGELDILDGSPPCQGFSIAGKRKFSDSRNQLFREYVRMVEGLQPRAFVMENVSGMIKGKMKLMFAEMTRALKATGYSVSCRLLNAWWYGVPQDRRRLIWIGVRPDLGWEPSHPVPLVKSPVSVAEALGAAGAETEEAWGVRNRPFDGHPGKAARRPRIREVGIKNPDCENKWKDGDGPAPTLKSSQPPIISVKNTGIARSFAFPVNARKEAIPVTRPSQSLTATGRPTLVCPDTVRPITIQEAKMLQGFPEWFEVQEAEYKYIGNSVCPPMAEAIGNHISNLLDTG